MAYFHGIQITETGGTAGAIVTPVVLGGLTLSGQLRIGTSASGTIAGATIGSLIVSQIPGITVDNATRTYAGTPTGLAGAVAGGLVETLVGVSNSPLATAITTLPALPTVSLSADLALPEGNSGAKLFTYTVTRSDSTGAIVVPWSFAQGTTNAADYTGGILPTGGTVALAAGVASGTFTISVNGDTVVEPDELFTVSIAAPAGYALGVKSSATGTILNDEAANAPAFAPQFTRPITTAGSAFTLTDHDHRGQHLVRDALGRAITLVDGVGMFEVSADLIRCTGQPVAGTVYNPVVSIAGTQYILTVDCVAFKWADIRLERWNATALAAGALASWAGEKTGATLVANDVAGQPSVVADAFGAGKNGVALGGRYMSLTDTDNAAAAAFIAALPTNWRANEFTIVVVGKLPSAAAQDLVGFGTTSALQYIMQSGATGTLQSYLRDDATAAAGVAPTAVGSLTNTVQIIGAVNNANNANEDTFDHYIDGRNSLGSSSNLVPAGASDGTFANTTFRLGFRTTGSGTKSTATIAYLDVYPRRLDAFQMMKLAQHYAALGLAITAYSLPDLSMANYALDWQEDFGGTYDDAFETNQADYINVMDGLRPSYLQGNGIDATASGVRGTLPGEVGYYADPNGSGMAQYNTHVVANGVLNLNAQVLPSTLAGQVNGMTFLTGSLISAGYKEFEGGVWELTCQVPPYAAGDFSAFWDLDPSNRWPPEIDGFEQFGNDVGAVSPGIHVDPYRSISGQTGKSQRSMGRLKGPDMSRNGYHSILFEKDQDTRAIRYYYDGKLVGVQEPLAGIYKIDVTAGGADYTDPVLTATGGGATTPATFVFNRYNNTGGLATDGFLLVDGGAGYTSAPTLTVTGGTTGTAATFTCSIAAGKVIGITRANVGTGYLSLTIPSPLGAVSVGKPTVVAGAVTKMKVTKSGSGFTADTAVVVTGGTGTGLAAMGRYDSSGVVLTPEMHVPTYIMAALQLGDFTGVVAASLMPRSLKIDAVRHYRKVRAAPAKITAGVSGAFDTTVSNRVGAIVNRMSAVAAAPTTAFQNRLASLVRQLSAWDNLRFDTAEPLGNPADWDKTKLSQWDATRALYLMEVEAAAHRTVNLIDPTGPLLLPVGSPAFVAGQPALLTAADYFDTQIDLTGDNLFRALDNGFGMVLSAAPSNTALAQMIGTTNANVKGSATLHDMQMCSTSPSGTIKGVTGEPRIKLAPAAGYFAIERGFAHSIRTWQDGQWVWHGYVPGTPSGSVENGDGSMPSVVAPAGTVKLGGGAVFGLRLAEVTRRLTEHELRQRRAIYQSVIG